MRSPFSPVAKPRCTARPRSPPTPRLTVVAPLGTRAPLPESPPDEPAAAFAGLDARARRATADAAKAGADITITVLDRNTGQIVSNGNNEAMPIASVVKLFIADDLLLQEAKGQTQLSPADRQALDVMLRSSDDSAAETFWNRSGGSAIIYAGHRAVRVECDHDAPTTGVGSTPSARPLIWSATTTSCSRGSGGLPPERANIMLSNLAASTPTAIDGMGPVAYTHSGSASPRGSTREPVAVKQGWMCCWNGGELDAPVHRRDRHRPSLRDGDRSMQPADANTARNTITQAVKTMFPGGRI